LFSRVLVWSRTAFDRRRHLRASLPATILREGRLLYETAADAQALAQEVVSAIHARLPEEAFPET
jgi:hypothetical protein